MAVLTCGSMLAGCTLFARHEEVMGGIPTDSRQRHPIVLKEGVRSVELFIGSRRGGLTGAQRADLVSFARNWKREASGGILVDLPAGTPNEAAAASIWHEIRSTLIASGAPPNAIASRPYQPADPNRLATITLRYPTTVASAGPCGYWPHDIGSSGSRIHSENVEHWNFGCAQSRNLAAMVDNPADLVQPRGEVPPYTGRRTTVLDKYHRGESTTTTYSDPNQGKITDIGR